VSAVIYSTNWFDFDREPRRRESPVRMLTEATHPIPKGDPRLAIPWIDLDARDFYGRACAGWWKYHPPFEEGVTIFVNANVEILVPDFAERCIEELGSDDILLMRHPYRDDIADERAASHPDPRFDGQDTAGQVQAYLDAGYPRHWGLFFAGVIVRRNMPEIQAFSDEVWNETLRWSGQDQIAIAYVAHKTDLKWHAWPDEGRWHARPFAEGWLQYGPCGQELAA
jgi:hypothetical protein